MAHRHVSKAHTMGRVIHMAESALEQGKFLSSNLDAAATRAALEQALVRLNDTATDPIGSKPYLRRSANEATYLAERMPLAVLASCRQLIEQPAALDFTGEASTSAIISRLLSFLLTVETAAGCTQQKTFNYEVLSVFLAATASPSRICAALLQRGAIYKVMHTPLPLDWIALRSEGGALHHSSVISLAAMLMYITAVVKSAGESHKQSAQW
jgi:hypothetical protein